MYVVANNFMLNKFKNIDIFTVDLGMNLKGAVNIQNKGKVKGNTADPNKLRIRDTFVKKYQNINNTFISKFGEIGSLKFYEDNSVPKQEIHIYKEDEIYELIVTDEDLNKDMKSYLTEIIKMVDESDDDNEKISQIAYTNLPEDLEAPDPYLPKEQYIEKLLERQKLIQNNGIKK